MGAQEELADVDRGEPAGDALEHDVEAVALGQHRVHERRADVEPSPAGLEHPLDELADLRGIEPQVGQLVPAAPRDEHPAGVVDPDLLDLGVVEERLERPEAGHPRHELADHRAGIGDRGDRAGEAELVVVADDVLGDAAYDERLALGVDALAPHPLAHLPVELAHELVVGVGTRERGRSIEPFRGHGDAPVPEMVHRGRYPDSDPTNRPQVKVVDNLVPRTCGGCGPRPTASRTGSAARAAVVAPGRRDRGPDPPHVRRS